MKPSQISASQLSADELEKRTTGSPITLWISDEHRKKLMREAGRRRERKDSNWRIQDVAAEAFEAFFDTAGESRATDKIAEEMARDILSDPAFRQEMRALIRRVFAATLTELGKDAD